MAAKEGAKLLLTDINEKKSLSALDEIKNLTNDVEFVIGNIADPINAKKVIDRAIEKYNVIDVENTGHNITTYFSYFDEHYDNLPEVICLLKGNMIGRHCSREFFEQVYDNKTFTFLYDEKQYWDRLSKYNENKEKNEIGTTFLAMENVYVEKNNSWYVDSPNHPKKYFNDVDDLLRFIY